ncbi:hypothetical protein, partial [Serratia marcescens]|uniref:hypothetical protein n=1 Tax=Serratia marcescens TaxID=615 RepID=UPI001C8C145F
ILASFGAHSGAIFRHSASQPFSSPGFLCFYRRSSRMSGENCKNKTKNGSLGRQAGHSSLKCAQFAKNWPRGRFLH